jgi:hypothetical protein
MAITVFIQVTKHFWKIISNLNNRPFDLERISFISWQSHCHNDLNLHLKNHSSHYCQQALALKTRINSYTYPIIETMIDHLKKWLNYSTIYNECHLSTINRRGLHIEVGSKYQAILVDTSGYNLCHHCRRRNAKDVHLFGTEKVWSRLISRLVSESCSKPC